MFRFIIPTILLGTSVAGFLFVVDPLYKDISLKRGQIASYNEALNNSHSLELERDKLTDKYNSIKKEDLDKLQKLLPDNVDNIRLVLEVGEIARPYGMVLRDVKYDAKNKFDANTDPSLSKGNEISKGEVVSVSNKNFGTWNLEFSTQGSYSNFLNFIKDLESNLRIVDISSIDFSSIASEKSSTNSSTSINNKQNDFYKYTFKVKTYWLKN